MRLNRRQENSKCATLPELTLHLDPSPVILNDSVRGVKAKPQATRNTFVYFGCETRLEHAHEQIRHNSTPGIRDRHSHPITLLIGLNSYPTLVSGTHRLD